MPPPTLPPVSAVNFTYPFFPEGQAIQRPLSKGYEGPNIPHPINTDMVAARISTPPLTLAWGLIAMASYSSPSSVLVFLFVPVFVSIRNPGRGL